MKTVIVDADGLIALFSKNDAHAGKAMHFLQQLVQDEAQILSPASVIIEAVTTLQRKIKQPEIAAEITHLVQEGQFPIVPVSEDTLLTALPYFKPTTGSKADTLFDAVVAAVAKEKEADVIFSFDQWYAKQGFTLIADL
jgi:predicted nucleic acid-binding protein